MTVLHTGKLLTVSGRTT